MSPIDRRDFARLGFGLTALAAGLPLSGCASLATVRVTPVGPERNVVRLAVRNHPQLDRPGGQLKLAVDGYVRPVYVLAQRDGSFRALSSVCTHLECTVDLKAGRLVCPCHGSTYDRDGTVLVGPAERPLAAFDVREVEPGLLEITL